MFQPSKPHPSYATRENFSKPLAIAIGTIHILALTLAPFTYTHIGLISFFVLYFLTMLGITAGYHRMLTHRSFKAVPAVKYLLTFFAILALQGSPIKWVAAHRLHHAHADDEEDPHSPITNTFLWAHLLWIFFLHPRLQTQDKLRQLAPDIYEDKGLTFFRKNFLTINILFGVVVVGTAFLVGGAKLALSLFVWGGMLRIVAVWHATWLVNSATHVWGYRNYDYHDHSLNNWWVTILCLGEGLHNNHHANPQAANNQHRWFEMDVSFWIIALLSRCGLVSDIVTHKKKIVKLKNKVPLVVEEKLVLETTAA